MGKVHPLTCSDSDEIAGYVFYCPGCKYDHWFTTLKRIRPDGGWTFNGDLVKPTFSPSLLVNGHGQGKRCHCYVRDGKIQFLGDCDHELAGQTIELEEYE